jgi:hypothetical protein
MSKSEINKAGRAEKDLVNRLSEHPELLERVEELLQIVENAAGDASTADETEEQIAEHLRRVGQDAMGAWAERKLERVNKRYEESENYTRREKKTSGGGHGSGK